MLSILLLPGFGVRIEPTFLYTNYIELSQAQLPLLYTAIALRTQFTKCVPETNAATEELGDLLQF